MPAPAASDAPSGYAARLSAQVVSSITQLARSPSQPQAGEASRRLLRQLSVLSAAGALIVIALMFGADVAEISLMPPRGSPGVWPARIVTDFGKEEFVLSAVAALLVAVTLIAPLMRGPARSRLRRLGT